MATEQERHGLTASMQERQTFWQEVPAGERMARWEAQMNQYLAASIRDPGNPGARAFLQKLLRASATEPLEGVEVSARALYSTLFDKDGRGESADFIRHLLKITTKAEREAQFDLIAGLLQIYGGESAEEALRLLRERHKAMVLGTSLTTGEEVLLPHRERPHVVTIGNTGTGKTTLQKHLISDTISRGLGVLVCDPHDGTLVNDVLGLIPERRLKDVYYFDLRDVTAPMGLNIFAVEDPRNITQVSQVTSFVMHLFETLFFSGGGLAGAPQFSQVMRNTSRVMIEQGLTMAEIPLLLTDDTVREKLTANLSSPQRQFWQEYNLMTPRQRRELTASTVNKLDAFLSDPLIAGIVSQQAAIPWRRLMDERAIILIALSRQHEQASRLVGTTILGQLLISNFSRMGAAYCPEFHVFCDEWHSLVTSDIATWIHEARKGRCVLHLANQSLSQLQPEIRQSALSAGALVAFRVGAGDDSKTLALSFDHTPAPDIRAPVSDVVGHLVRRGHSHQAVGQLVMDYLLPLQALIRKVGVYEHEFALGGAVLHPSHLIDGQRLVNDVLHECMRTGRADGFIPPLALFTLGGAADPRSTYVFFHHLKRKALNGYVLEGFSGGVNAYGRAGFLSDEQQAFERLKKEARASIWDFFTPRVVVERASAFLRMLKSLRQAMAILAQQPVLVDTGESPADFRPRSFADAAAALANSLTRMENFTARVKIASDEHLIRTHPAPEGVSGRALEARIRLVKDRMLERGLCRDALEVTKLVEERHEALRRPVEERPRRRRDAEPPPPAYG